MNIRKKVLRRFGPFLIIVAVHASVVFGQEVSVTATVDSAHITMGDWLNVNLRVRHADSTEIEWSALKDTLGVFEIVRLDTLARTVDGHSVTEGGAAK